MLRSLKSIYRSQQGVALIEFALTLPLLLLLLFGGIELTRYILVNHKIDKATNTLDDLATQKKTLTDAELDTIIGYMPNLIRPYKWDANDKVILTVVEKPKEFDENGNPIDMPPKVKMQRPPGAGSKVGSIGGNATLPNNFTMIPGETVVVAESFYRFRPIFGDDSYFLNLFRGGDGGSALSSQRLEKTAVMRPRLSQSQACETSCVPPGEPQNIPEGCFERPICAEPPPPPCELRCPDGSTPQGCDLARCPSCRECSQTGNDFCLKNEQFPDGTNVHGCPNPPEEGTISCEPTPICCRCYTTIEDRDEQIANGCVGEPWECFTCSQASKDAGCLVPGDTNSPGGAGCPTTPCCSWCYNTPRGTDRPDPPPPATPGMCDSVQQCPCGRCETNPDVDERRTEENNWECDPKTCPPRDRT